MEYNFAPYSVLCDLSHLSLRQLVKSYNYAQQFVDFVRNARHDTEFWLAQSAQVKVEITRRIAR